MPWVCPMCSTNNDDTATNCFVCETEKPSGKVCTLTYTKVQKLGLGGDVVVPFEFNVIGEGAFRDREDIYSIVLHGSVKKISKEAFSGCKNLTAIICEHKLDSVGTRAFAYCESLPELGRVQAKYVSKDAYCTAADDEFAAEVTSIAADPEPTPDYTPCEPVSLSDDIYGETYDDEPKSFFARALRKIKGFFGF